jgi:hypothetical protein
VPPIRAEDGIVSDPTDHALATIASILDQPEAPRVVDAPPPAEKPVVEEATPTVVPADGDGYFKVGPGPMEAIRFKWKVRRTDDGDYYVDETIGESSAAHVTGPMWKDEAVKFVDDREREARQRYEQLRAEMTGRASAADVIRSSGEA